MACSSSAEWGSFGRATPPSPERQRVGAAVRHFLGFQPGPSLLPSCRHYHASVAVIPPGCAECRSTGSRRVTLTGTLELSLCCRLSVAQPHPPCAAQPHQRPCGTIAVVQRERPLSRV